MNKADLIDAVAARIDSSKKDAAAAVEAVVDAIQEAVAAGQKVSISGFGVFEQTPRAERTYRRPSTGEAIKKMATSVPRFRPSGDFKKFVAGEKHLVEGAVRAARDAGEDAVRVAMDVGGAAAAKAESVAGQVEQVVELVVEQVSGNEHVKSALAAVGLGRAGEPGEEAAEKYDEDVVLAPPEAAGELAPEEPLDAQAAAEEPAAAPQPFSERDESEPGDQFDAENWVAGVEEPLVETIGEIVTGEPPADEPVTLADVAAGLDESQSPAVPSTERSAKVGHSIRKLRTVPAPEEEDLIIRLPRRLRLAKAELAAQLAAQAEAGSAEAGSAAEATGRHGQVDTDGGQ